MHAEKLPFPEQDIIAWDVVTWGRALQFWRENTRLSLDGARVLEIGAGRGGLSLFFAAQGAHVLCTELHDPVAARAFHAGHKVRGTISYRTLDLTRWADDLGSFDIICAKSVLGILGHDPVVPYQQVIRSIVGALRLTGEYWFADNLRASAAHRLLRSAFVPWGRSYHYFGEDELRGYFPQDVTLASTTFGVLGALGRTEQQRTMLSTVERAMRLERLLPAHWRYVFAGIAKPRRDLAAHRG